MQVIGNRVLANHTEGILGGIYIYARVKPQSITKSFNINLLEHLQPRNQHLQLINRHIPKKTMASVPSDVRAFIDKFVTSFEAADVAGEISTHFAGSATMYGGKAVSDEVQSMVPPLSKASCPFFLTQFNCSFCGERGRFQQGPHCEADRHRHLCVLGNQ